jgi:hypothetical protein
VRRLSRRDWGALAVAVAAVGAVSVLLAILAPRWWGGERGTFAPQRLAARSSAEPATSLFGDLVMLRADVLVDRRDVAPGSVRIEARFTPFRLVTRARRVRNLSARASRIEYEFGIQCVSLACLRAGVRRDEGGAVRATPIALRRGRVVAEPRAGQPIRTTFAWPEVVVQSRLTQRVIEGGEPQVGRFPTPPRTQLIAADLAGGLLLAVGALLALGGGYLLARVVRGSRVVLRLRLPSHLTPLDRAVALVRAASDNGDEVGERKALERLSAELRRHGEGTLAEAAGQLAWSAGPPSPVAVDDLIVSVSRSVNGR